MSGDHANDVIAATAGLHHLGGYRDTDVAMDVFDTIGGFRRRQVSAAAHRRLSQAGRSEHVMPLSPSLDLKPSAIEAVSIWRLLSEVGYYLKNGALRAVLGP